MTTSVDDAVEDRHIFLNLKACHVACYYHMMSLFSSG